MDTTNPYLDDSQRPDRFSGGVRMIPIDTPKGTFNVWTKRHGNNPTIKLLFVHGGPGATHEFFESADSYLPAAGIEYYFYDQLGSWYSDKPQDDELWEIGRFVDEVDQVRTALCLDSTNLFLLGQSWGGMLAMEYAVHHQDALKGLVISNMMSSSAAYNDYANNVLMPSMNQDVLAEIKEIEARGDTDNPRYMDLLMEHHYEHHVLRRPFAEWPEPAKRGMDHINPPIYVKMQGPSELGMSGTLENWDRTDDLATINVPTLVIGAKHDTMDPAWMRMMSERLANGRYLECPNGSHLANIDDADVYYAGVIEFLRDVDNRGS
jgi:proline iminopeptidase